MSPRPGGDVSNSAEFAILGSGERPVYIGPPAAARYVREHPTLIIAIAYLAVTLVGVACELWFYQSFRINFLEYAGVGDFLSAPLRNPLAVALALLPGLLLFAFFSWKQETPTLNAMRWLGPSWSNPAVRLATYGTLLFAYAVLSTNVSANRLSRRVKDGSGQRVSFARNDGPRIAEKPILLGSTAKFFFLYYPARKVTEIVPFENTALLTVEARTRSERSRDSAAASGVSAGAGNASPPLNP